MKRWEREQLEFIYKAQGYEKKEVAEKLKVDIDEEKINRSVCRNVGKNFEEEQLKIAILPAVLPVVYGLRPV